MGQAARGSGALLGHVDISIEMCRLMRTSRGRMLGEPGWRHLGLAIPPREAGQLDLLRDPGADGGGDARDNARENE